jgi:hypothetical protein
VLRYTEMVSTASRSQCNAWSILVHQAPEGDC